MNIPKEIEKKLSPIKKRKKIKEYYPNILDSDYYDQFIYRYFAKNLLTNRIYEINEDNYNSLLSKSEDYPHELYQLIKIQWKIIGPKHDIIESGKISYGVFDTNKRVVNNAELTMNGISKKLYDLTKFAKIT